MKIAVIFTGGTIGSAANEKYVALSRENTPFLMDKYHEKYRKDIEFAAFTPYFIHSENLTFDDISQLTACVSKVLTMDFDGIIITHGTDTLQFTAAAMRLIFADAPIPIIIVSSNYPLGDKRANGLVNFASAVEFIVRNISVGVFVSYKNNSELPEIHSGSRLLAFGDFSDNLHSAKNEIYGSFANSCFIKNPHYVFRKNESADKLRLNAEFQDHSNILMINPYVGLVYPKINDNIKAVLLTSYHSGTIRTHGGELVEFSSLCKEKNIPMFFVGMLKDEKHYESTELFESQGIMPLFNITPICAYIKLTLLLSGNYKDLYEKMNTPVTDEFFA